jgi:fructose-1,6-bisphosphatase/inositol monophosphatase family enzyme
MTGLAGYGAELAVASDAARRAGVLQIERYERLERIVHKSEHDVVTEVDGLSETLIISALRDAYPGDAFLAEESGATSAVRSGGGSAAGKPEQRTWVIDPLDGTVNYANGIPVFCVSIGLVVGGRPVLGVIHDPVRDEMFSAQRGGGAWLDGQPIRASGKQKLSDSVVSLALRGSRWSRREGAIRRRIRVARSLGSAALSLAYVANGRFDAFVQVGGMSAWDVCAAGMIALEAGALVTALDGGEWFDMARRPGTSSVLAAPPDHHRQLLELLE